MELTWPNIKWLNKKPKTIQETKIELIIFIFAFIVGIFATLFFYEQGMLAMLVDEVAHLNISRQVVDSMTPGFSQLGLWPPLLHLVIAPFAQIDFLWRSGIAGSIPSVFFFSISCVYIYKIIRYITQDTAVSLLGLLLFVLNPYILYFSSVAMMEMLFLMNLIIAAFYYIKWEKENQVMQLALFSIFISLASISRFEGLVLPFAFLFLILLHKAFPLFKKKKGELEATLIIFLFLSCCGGLTILIYSAVFAGSPLAFVSGEWSAFAQQHQGGFLLPAEHNAYNAFLYMFYAASYMAGVYFVVASCASALILLVMRKKEQTKVLLILAVPFLFDILSLYRGNSVIYTPELPPFERFFNIRYGLLLIPFIAVSIALLLGSIKSKLIRTPLAVVFIAFSFWFFSSNIGANDSVIKKEAIGYPSPSSQEVAANFRQNYDGGKVLVMRSLNDYFIKNSGINIKDTINESNYLYWDQSLKEPWLFERWIVMANPDSGLVWEVKRDKIAEKWAADDKIYKFYDIIFKNKDYVILKINEDKINSLADKNHLKKENIPSLNRAIVQWDTKTIKNEIEKGE